MSALYLLNSQDFKVSEDKLVFTKNKALTFVLFYSTKCRFCGPAREVFNFVASQYVQKNVKFGIINVTKNPSVPQLSKGTNTPISYVPFLTAYFDGDPLSVFSSQYTAQNFSEFVKKCYASVSNSFTKKEEPVNEVPKYTVGIPFCEDGVCYLEFEDAYSKK